MGASGQLSQPLCHAQESPCWYPLNRRLHGLQTCSWIFWRGEKFPAPSGIQTPGCLAHSLFTMWTVPEIKFKNMYFWTELRQWFMEIILCTWSVRKVSDLWPGKRNWLTWSIGHLIILKVVPLGLHTLLPAVPPLLEAYRKSLFRNGV